MSIVRGVPVALGARARRTHGWLRAAPTRIDAWARAELLLQGSILTADEVRATRTSDTIFVFGCGYSINDLTEPECRHFEEHDTFGFNFFYRQNLLRVDYHLFRELATDDLVRTVWKPEIEAHFHAVAASPHYRDTILFLQKGFRAINSNQALGYRIVPSDRRVFRFRSDPARATLAHSLVEALPHRNGTLEECINLAYLLGWTTIVLVGIDLYDRRYFWLGPEETAPGDVVRDASWRDVHHTARDGALVERIGGWRSELSAQGVDLHVYNPRSLLAQVLPVYMGAREALPRPA